jgi:hypothetical protein
VFGLVRRLTGSTTIAALSALLLIVAGARGYSYPKGIVYAVAATLWWGYVSKPGAARIAAFGAWAAAAFYWRPDHGVYIALAIVLAALVAHGLRPTMLLRCSLAGAVTLALTAPFLLYVHLVVGLPEYVQTGFVQAQVEHTTHGTHEWPLVRYAGQILAIDPAEDYAPVVTIRWTPASSPESRREVLARYDLTPLASDDDLIDRVRLSERAIGNVRGLVNEHLVEDTAGIDRSTATLPSSSWPTWQRWAFTSRLLRVRVLPSLDAHARASEFTVAWFYALPFLLLVATPWAARFLSNLATPPRLAAFALLALIVDVGMLRNPFPARAPDAVVLAAIAYGCCVAMLWRAATAARMVWRLPLRIFTIALVIAVTTNVAGAGEFAERVNWLAGQWTSVRRARGAWDEARGELLSSPPLRYFQDRPAGVSLRLAAYVRACVPPSDRLLVLWFAPEIYYHSDRLMAQRHLVFAPAWSSLPHEQRMTLEKVRRFAPPVALARLSALDRDARATYPGVVEYVDREYQRAGIIEESNEQYVVLARRDRLPLRTFGEQQWPCYTSDPSPWERVGRAD